MNKLISITVLILGLSPGLALAQQEWNFRVFLDDREIGRHDFTLQQEGSTEQVSSTADFEYRLLFMTLYEYQHSNTEVWEGDCLASIQSRTNANGDQFRVEGQREDQGFLLESAAGQELLPSCISTFAYWNHDFLSSAQLLNSQNGELLEVDVSDPEPDQLMVRGRLVNTNRYKLQAGEMSIRLWYSETNEWLALESDARGGRVLRYELM